jgi:hypothetical protein
VELIASNLLQSVWVLTVAHFENNFFLETYKSLKIILLYAEICRDNSDWLLFIFDVFIYKFSAELDKLVKLTDLSVPCYLRKLLISCVCSFFKLMALTLDYKSDY